MIVTPSIQFSSCDSQKFISIPSIHWSGFPTWNRTATPPGSFGVDSALGSVQDFQSNFQAFHITVLHCQNFQLFDNKFYPAWTDHVWRESDYNNGVKDHADDPQSGFCGRHLVKFRPYALHPNGHPDVNNPVPGHFLSPTNNSPVYHTCDL